MAAFRVNMRPGGWWVTDGDREHGPYPTRQQALQTAENLNLQRRSEEERSFAPIEPTLSSGERRDSHMVEQMSGGQAVIHGEHPGAPLPAQMVSETRGAESDRPAGEVLVYPEEPTVWEAVEEPVDTALPDPDRAAREAVERARVGGSDSPAAGSASLGGGLV